MENHIKFVTGLIIATVTSAATKVKDNARTIAVVGLILILTVAFFVQSREISDLTERVDDTTEVLNQTSNALKDTTDKLKAEQEAADSLEAKKKKLEADKKKLEKSNRAKGSKINSLKRQVAAKKAREAEAKKARIAVASRPAVVKAVPATTQPTVVKATAVRAAPTPSQNNTYPFGQCTWHVANRAGVPNYLGNANQWHGSLPAHGYSRVSARAGAVGVQNFGNHVVYAESVNANGTVNISEANYSGLLYHARTVPAGDFTWFVR